MFLKNVTIGGQEVEKIAFFVDKSRYFRKTLINSQFEDKLREKCFKDKFLVRIYNVNFHQKIVFILSTNYPVNTLQVKTTVPQICYVCFYKLSVINPVFLNPILRKS